MGMPEPALPSEPWADASVSAPSRREQLRKLRGNEEFDVLIIGGGATGAGAAVDAATRGLRTALIEGEDFGSGTSSRSTKLVHGGVRYLEKAVFQLSYGQLKLVFEALHERKNLLRNAPHLARPLPIATPCYHGWEVPYYWAGMKAYDLVAGASGLTMSGFRTAAESLALFPTLAAVRKEDGASLKGTIVYRDGQFDDARLNVALACTAAHAGAAEVALWRAARGAATDDDREGLREGREGKARLRRRRCHSAHVAATAAAGVFFVAEEVAPDAPLMHAAWHVFGAAAILAANEATFGDRATRR